MVGVVFGIYEIDVCEFVSGLRSRGVAVYLNCREVCEIDERPVPMIRREVVFREKVGTDDRLPYISDDKGEVVGSFPDADW